MTTNFNKTCHIDLFSQNKILIIKKTLKWQQLLGISSKIEGFKTIFNERFCNLVINSISVVLLEDVIVLLKTLIYHRLQQHIIQ